MAYVAILIPAVGGLVTAIYNSRTKAGKVFVDQQIASMTQRIDDCEADRIELRGELGRATEMIKTMNATWREAMNNQHNPKNPKPPTP